MGPTNKELEIIMRLKDEVSKKVDTLKGKFIQFTNSMKKNWVDLAAKVFLFKQAVQLAGSALKEVEAGARFKQIQDTFKNVAASVGADASKLIKNLKEASGETISTAEAIERASGAIVLGLDANTLGRMMEIARASARAYGKDVGEMFESITLGASRQSRQILDNLGIVVSANKAYSDYAAEIGKSADALTDSEKKQAFINATLKAGERIMAQVNVQGRTQLENIQALKAKWDDFRKGTSEFVSEHEGVTGAIKGMTEFVGKLADKITLANKRMREGTEENLAAQIIRVNGLIEKQIQLTGRLPFVSQAKQEAVLNGYLERRTELFKQLNELRMRGASISEDELQNAKERAEQEAALALGKETELRKIGFLIDDLNSERRTKFEALMASHMSLLNEFREVQLQAHADVTQLAANVISQFNSGMSNALAGLIIGTKSAKEAFSELGQQMLKTVVDFIVQKGVALAIEKTLGAAAAKVTALMAAGLAKAWAPAAALASLATAGGNAAPAAAAIVSTNALTQGFAATALARARGGDDIVRKPTLFLAGEAGPERARFTPLGGPFKGRGAGGDGIVINIGTINAAPGIDPRMIAQAIADHTRRELRYSGI